MKKLESVVKKELKSNHGNSSNNNEINIDLKEWTLTTLLQELINAKEGLINLKTTYNDDEDNNKRF